MTVTPARGRSGTTFTVSVEATRPLEGPPRVILGLDPLVELPCTATTGNAYSCAYTATGLENERRGGRVSLDLRMVDAAGNATARNGIGAVELDFAAPVLAARSAEPAAVPVGGVLQVFFAPDEELGAPPVLVASRPLDGGAGPQTRFTPERQAGTRNYRFTHLVTASDAPGPLEFTVDLVDAVGNTATASVIGGVVVDSQVPRITSLAVTPARLDPTGVLTIAFEATEPGTAAVTVGERAVPCGAWTRLGGAAYSATCTRAMLGTEIPAGTEQAEPVVVRLTDPAGNAASALGNVVFDFAPPALQEADVAPAAAGLGGLLQVFLTFSEALGSPPVLVASAPLVRGAAGPQTRFELYAQPGTLNYVFTHAVTEADAPGTISFAVEATDVAGNRAPPLPAGSITIDNVVPQLGSVLVTPARVAPSDVLTVSFDASEAGSVAVAVGGRPMSCGAWAPTSPSHVCTRAMSGDELPSGTEAAQSIVIDLHDAAGNAARASASTVFDFRAPGLSTAAVAYLPDPSNPLAKVARAGAGTSVRMTLVADEPLRLDPPPELRATLDATELRFTLVGGPSATGATFEAIVPPGAPDGTYRPTLRWADVAGNATELTFSDPPILIKTSRPALAVDQAQVTFLRSPWGNAAAEDLGGFTIPAGPYFALAPPEPLSPAPTLPAGTFSAGEVSAAAVRIWADPGRQSLLGVAQRNPDGSWPRARLIHMDAPAAWATIVDDAGNESDAVRIATSEWVATANRPNGTSPHVASASSYLTETFVPSAQTAAAMEPGLAGMDSAPLEIRARGTFRRMDGGKTPTPARTRHAMAYDSVRGRVVLFGGEDAVTHASQGDTWEWDGLAWENRSGTGPSPRYGHAMAYDSARGRVVLYGGYPKDAEDRTHTWEWDGSIWTDVTPPGESPGFRNQHAMAYDPVRGRTVLFGGSVESSLMWTTWEWDGSAWTRVATADLAPERIQTAMAYDAVRGRIVMYGGQNPRGASFMDDLREYDGTSWREVVLAADAARPPGVNSHLLVQDSARGRLVLYGGNGWDGAGGLWEWDGASWTQPVAAGPYAPAQPSSFAAAYDLARRQTVFFGNGAAAETWVWDGDAWKERTLQATRPGPGTLIAYDVGRGRTVYADATRLWEFDGVRWSNRTPAAPPASAPRSFQEAVATWDPTAQRVVVFGAPGTTGVWDWNGSDWSQRALSAASAAAPGAFCPALTFDAARSKLVVFDSPQTLEAGAAVDGLTWTARTPAVSPASRFFPTLMNDGERTWLFFGTNNTNGDCTWGVCYSDVWVWNEAANTWENPFPAGPVSSGSVAWDSHGRRALVFGGADGVFEFTAAGFERLLRPPSARWPGAASLQPGKSVMAFDAGRGRAVLMLPTLSGTEHWEWDVEAGWDSRIGRVVQRRTPMAQLTVSYRDAGFSEGQVTALRVRGRAGAVFGYSATGAQLLGWRTGGGGAPAGAWTVLQANFAGLPLAAATAAMLEWSAPADDLSRFFLRADGQLGFQLRPAGAPAATEPEARLGADYLEVRIRYVAP